MRTFFKKAACFALALVMLMGLLPQVTFSADAVTEETHSWDVDGDGVLEIIAIGNSFAVDALQYVWQIANDLGIEEIAIGNLYIAGSKLDQHIANATGDLPAYTYYYNDNGTWTSTANYKISTALKSRSWDYVSLQQQSGNSGVESTYNEDLTNLIAYVKETLSSKDNQNRNPSAKLIWHMTWAYQQDCTKAAFATYNNDQMTMYNAIVAATQSKICTNENFDIIVPTGTAVQNTRTSLVGDTLTRDGYHMSYDYGRYVTGLMFVKTVTGLDIDGIQYAPSGVSEQYRMIAVESVNNAAAQPFAVTQSVHTGEAPAEGYIHLQPELYKGAYWQPKNKTRYNVLISDASNCSKYFATPRFTREELPVGSIIILEDGWQYRPDGWVTDTLQTGTREAVTTQSYVVVTEEWWADYTIRSFNICKVGMPDLSDETEETVRAALRIYVPEESHVHKYEEGKCVTCFAMEGYVQLQPELYKGAYWQPKNKDRYNVLISDVSNCSKYFATMRFTREELPVGTVIVLEDGWQYRPDGWVTDTLQTGTREAVTTQACVTITDEWWGDYTIRSFNICKVGMPSLSDVAEETVRAALRIYVPEESHVHKYEEGKCVTCGAKREYTQLQLELYKGAYWHPKKANRYNELITDVSNCSKYYATMRFTREDLPVGSVIVLEEGWRYRPDGWVTDTLQTGTREAVTTQAYVVVTEEWWGDYTLRAFNITKTDGSSLSDVAEETVRNAFRIYIPA